MTASLPVRRLVDNVVGFLRPEKRSERSSQAERLREMAVEHDRLRDLAADELGEPRPVRRGRFLWPRHRE